jgi:hypothetical protein
VRNVIFRWTIWNATPFSIFMLCHSVETFRRFFGPAPRYIVFADDPTVVDAMRLCRFELADLKDIVSPFADPRGNWRKWAPPRLDIRAVELRIDSDIFLLADPADIRSFCEGQSGRNWLVTQEEFSAPWPYGNFAPRLPAGFVPMNVGLVGQAEGCDISADLQNAYDWWSTHVPDQEIKYHDEQGAVAYCLQRPARSDDVLLLDPGTHRVVCLTNDPPVNDVGGLILMHATYPDHPAFVRFIGKIAEVSGLPSTIPGKPPTSRVWR